MSNEMWRYVVAAFLFLHGIGHSGGQWMFVRSWLSPELPNTPWKWIFVAIWLVVMIGFVAAGVFVLQQNSSWRTLAIAASVVSLVVAALYIQGAPLNAAIADLVILAGLVWVNWPSAELVGS